MQSFKQFLKEDILLDIFQIQIYFVNLLTGNESKAIADKIKKTYKSMSWNKDLETLSISIPVDRSRYNEHVLNDIYNTVISDAEQISEMLGGNQIDGATTKVIISEVGNKVVDWNEIHFLPENQTSLIGIDKIIPSDCEFLCIGNCKKIIGPVLSLFKIKKHISIELLNPNELWAKIVEKHLSSRDVLSCQEELIENGLEEYAKF